MAADLIMPTLPGDQHSRHFFPQRPAHQRNQSYQISVGPQISPINTNTSSSPDSVSSNPTSPRAHHTRQTRPMYMPAALRPNLFPSKTNKLPMDDGASASSTESDGTLRRTNSSLINIPGMSVFGNKLVRVSTGDSAQSSIDGDFDHDMFPEVKAQPTRKHWKPDSESTVCDDPTCKRNFSYFTRRHHCRKCGNIFCDFHSTFAAPLDHDAKFNPRAPLSRTCRHCFDEFKSWCTRNNSRASSAASSDAPNPTPSTPIAAGFGDASELPRGPEIAASVPRDWNWSTF